MKVRKILSSTSALLLFILPAALAANPEDLHTLKGTDPPLDKLLESGAIVVGQRMGKGPVPGAKVVVNHERLEKLTGKLPSLDTKHITGIQHFAGHGNRRSFPNWARWYQEDGNTQIFRVHQGDWQFRDPDPDTAIPGRIEAYTRSMQVEPGTWLEWEGTITIIKPHGGVMFQMFHHGPQLWAFHLGMGSDGSIRFNRRRNQPGKEKNIVLGENMTGKPLTIKIRTNAEDFEIYKKRPLIDEDWEFVTDGSYRRGNDNKVQFRWGWYLGRTQGAKASNDAIYFVTGTTIRTSAGELRPAAAAETSATEEPAATERPPTTTAPPAPALRTWTDREGRGILAKMRRFNDEVVEILREDDMSFAIPLERLSEADHKYLKMYRDSDYFVDL